MDLGFGIGLVRVFFKARLSKTFLRLLYITIHLVDIWMFDVGLQEIIFQVTLLEALRRNLNRSLKIRGIRSKTLMEIREIFS